MTIVNKDPIPQIRDLASGALVLHISRVLFCILLGRRGSVTEVRTACRIYDISGRGRVGIVGLTSCSVYCILIGSQTQIELLASCAVYSQETWDFCCRAAAKPGVSLVIMFASFSDVFPRPI